MASELSPHPYRPAKGRQLEGVCMDCGWQGSHPLHQEKKEAKTMVEPKTKSESESKKEFVPDWSVIAGLKSAKVKVLGETFYIDELTATIMDRQKQKKDLETEIDELKSAALKLLTKADVKTILVNDARVTRVEGSRPKLNKERLVKEHGPKVLTWLKEATDYTPYTSLKITPPGEKDEREES